MPRLHRRELLRAIALGALTPSLVQAQGTPRFGIDFERRQAGRDGLALLVLVLPNIRKLRESDGILWGDFFSCASHEELADVALVRVASSLLRPLQMDLPIGCKPLPEDTILALYPPREREPRVVLRAHLPRSCRTGITQQPWPSASVPQGLPLTLRELIHPDTRTITARFGALEQALDTRGATLPTERARLIAFARRLAAESAEGTERAKLLAATGAHFELMLRRDPAEGLSWANLPGSRSHPVQCGPCGVGYSAPQSRRFLRFYVDLP